MRNLSTEKERKIDELDKKIQRVSHAANPFDTRISRDYIVRKVSKLRELLIGAKKSLPIIQAELRRLLDGKITLHPEDHGDYVDLKTTVRARLDHQVTPPLSVFVYSGTGNRTPV